MMFAMLGQSPSQVFAKSVRRAPASLCAPAAASGAWLHSLQHATPLGVSRWWLADWQAAGPWSLHGPRVRRRRDRAVKRLSPPRPAGTETFLRHVPAAAKLAGSSIWRCQGLHLKSRKRKGQARPARPILRWPFHEAAGPPPSLLAIATND